MLLAVPFIFALFEICKRREAEKRKCFGYAFEAQRGKDPGITAVRDGH